jgi:hypothetical protein
LLGTAFDARAFLYAREFMRALPDLVYQQAARAGIVIFRAPTQRPIRE